MVLIYTYILLYIWVIGFSFWAARNLQVFLNHNARISSRQSLDEYRALARKNMYAAVIMIFVLLGTLLLGLAIIFRFGFRGLLVMLAGNALTFLLGRYVGKYEKRVKTLPADSEELAAQQRRITEAWGKRLLPNF